MPNNDHRERNITKTICLRLPIALADRLDRIAHAGDEATASVAKRILISQLNEMHAADQLPVVVTPRRRQVRIPDPDIAAVGSLSGAIGRLTGATVQLSKSVREQGADNSEIEGALIAIRTASAKILVLHQRLEAAA